MSYDPKRCSLILAALLHDIGKFYQRAYPEKTNLSSTTINLQQHICPFNRQGRFFSHNHVLWTNEFFEKHLKEYNEAANLAIYHHKPENREQKIIQLADWLSSGERTIRDSDEKPTKISQEPLISIFSQVKLNNKATSSYYCRPTPITPNIEDIFPVEQKDMAINQKTNFKTLWDEFEHEFGMIKIENSDFPKIFTRIFSLLEKYTLFVPSSSYTDQPNISLFHHMKSTAAIATCIYDSNLKEQEIEQIIEKFQFGHDIDRKDFVLISGDISGIQDFIYSVTTEHALKGLRGRSFYIQMLSETIARYIIDSLELTECNLLFCGGGNFSILASNSTKALEKIEEIEKEATKKIFSIHSNLALILGWTELDYKDFLADNFPNAIDRLRLDLNIKKRRKFVNALDYPTIFEPFPKNVDKELSGCEICGAEIENQGKCEFCQSFEDLAYEIKKTDTLSITRNTSRSQKIWEKLFSSLGYSYSFKKTDTKDAINYAINDTNFLSKNCDGWRFEPFYSPGGTLEEIVEKAQGDKKWAALRMDVDNLGMIFSEGLKEKMSISRFSMLSYMMNHFFTAGIDWIRREKFNNCYVVYAGGDDLFILGPWSDIPYYAIEILDKFKSYTCNNPAITISAGVFIAPSKGFPVYRAAIESGKSIEQAKDSGKNRVYFLETVATWDEFKEIEKVAVELSELIDKLNVSRSILNIFYAGYLEEELLEKRRIPYIRIWRIFYAIKRFMERHKDRNIQQRLEELRKKFITPNFDIQPKLNTAVRWAELLTKKEKQGS